MTVKQLLEHNFTAVALPDGERTVDGVYIGDLLSWVMGKASADDAWITIMSNINVVAVASLTDTACVILAEGVELSEDIIDTANSRMVNILSFEGTAYEAALKLAELL